MTTIQTPKSVPELLKLLAKHGKRSLLVSGAEAGGDKSPAGKVVIDMINVEPLNEIEIKKDKITIGTGMSLGRLTREGSGANGLIRQAASLVANPLVRNKITFLEALSPESPYFDLTTPLVLLEAKVRLQSPASKRTLSIRDYLDSITKGLKKGEIPTAVEFPGLPVEEKVGFFRVARMGGKGTVSAAARMKLVRTICVDPEIVVSSLTLVPLRAKLAEKEIGNKPASESSIKRASQIAADEILAMAEKDNPYERTLIEITVARTLRSIMEGSMPV
ncbi:MAG TPA: FAD binding domain-containing protein [Terriglobia bacterium]|jgi:carbon-monoxide dehydrogenase medium subunit